MPAPSWAGPGTCCAGGPQALPLVSAWAPTRPLPPLPPLPPAQVPSTTKPRAPAQTLGPSLTLFPLIRWTPSLGSGRIQTPLRGLPLRLLLGRR